MEYRMLPHGGDRIGVIGLGASVLAEHGERAAAEMLAAAFEGGVNYIDMAAGHAAAFPGLGRALRSAAAGQRGRLRLQVHFGADYTSGAYGWTTALDAVRHSVDWQLSQIGTDYIDFGFMHCLDEKSDLAAYRANGVLDYLLELKRDGTVRHLGLSTHTPELAHAVLDLGIVDMLMFSINPAYDYARGEYGIGEVAERQELYRRCEAEGVGISVMKPFASGQLLDARRSPFGAALGKYQCLQYALDKPAVITVLAGAASPTEVHELLGYFSATPEERDYAVLSTFAPAEVVGTCVYCGHCAPCPKGINVGLVNKYYDLARAGDPLATEHYLTLEKRAGDCAGCGHCDRRCPFQVEQSARMREIAAYFGA